MNCKLIGNVYQSLEVTLEPREEFFAEKGALVYMDAAIQRQSITNGNGIMGMLSSKLSGESLFLVKYTNPTHMPLRLVVSGSSGSLSYFKVSPGVPAILRRGDYVASTRQVTLDLNLSINKFFTGAGLAYQKVSGDATVFFDAIDKLIVRDLAPGEEIVVDEDHVKAMIGISDAQITAARSNIFKNLMSGEGFLMTTVRGPGKVLLSSMPHHSLEGIR